MIVVQKPTAIALQAQSGAAGGWGQLLLLRWGGPGFRLDGGVRRVPAKLDPPLCLGTEALPFAHTGTDGERLTHVASSTMLQLTALALSMGDTLACN